MGLLWAELRDGDRLVNGQLWPAQNLETCLLGTALLRAALPFLSLWGGEN